MVHVDIKDKITAMVLLEPDFKGHRINQDVAYFLLNMDIVTKVTTNACMLVYLSKNKIIW